MEVKIVIPSHKRWDRVLTTTFKRIEIPDMALDKHNERGRRLRRGWAHFFDEGTQLANKADVSREAEFREAAKRAISNPSGDSLFVDE